MFYFICLKNPHFKVVTIVLQRGSNIAQLQSFVPQCGSKTSRNPIKS